MGDLATPTDWEEAQLLQLDAFLLSESKVLKDVNKHCHCGGLLSGEGIQQLFQLGELLFNVQRISLCIGFLTVFLGLINLIHDRGSANASAFDWEIN